MSRVFVMDAHGRPLAPCTPARARLLLKQHKAAVLRRFPFTLILKEDKIQAEPIPLRLKLDPGAKTTGMAVLDEARGEVVWAAELSHRGHQVRDALTKRRAARRSRRQRHTRYRAARFANRRRKPGWLPPSLRSRLQNVLTWVARLLRLCPIGAVSIELAKFDAQLLQQPDLTGDAYQFGTLSGCEMREYVLLKWNHACAYCGATNVPLELDHVNPRSRGGSHRESNRVPACRACNQRKGQQPVEEFLRDKPEVLCRIQASLKTPLGDTAALNGVRWELYKRVQAIGLPLETGSGGRTKWNRTRRGFPKTHWIDAACVGASTPEHLHLCSVRPLLITATGRQRRQMCLMDRYGFPRTRAKQSSVVQGFRTGDMVRAAVTSGKKTGVFIGRVAVRATGSFNLTTRTGTVQGIPARCVTAIQHDDGFSYMQNPVEPPSGARMGGGSAPDGV